MYFIESFEFSDHLDLDNPVNLFFSLQMPRGIPQSSIAQLPTRIFQPPTEAIPPEEKKDVCKIF